MHAIVHAGLCTSWGVRRRMGEHHSTSWGAHHRKPSLGVQVEREHPGRGSLTAALWAARDGAALMAVSTVK